MKEEEKYAFDKFNEINEIGKFEEVNENALSWSFEVIVRKSSKPNEFGRFPEKFSNSIDFNWGRVNNSEFSNEFSKWEIFKNFTVKGINSLTGIWGRVNFSKSNSNWFNRENNLNDWFSWGIEIKYFHLKNSSSVEIFNEEIKNRKIRVWVEIKFDSEGQDERKSENSK